MDNKTGKKKKKNPRETWASKQAPNNHPEHPSNVPATIQNNTM